MAEDREFFAQELVSARYLVQSNEDTEPEIERPVGRQRPNRTGLEQAVRWMSAFVFIFVVAAAGGLYWQNRASIASSGRELRRHSTSAFDLLLWASGSKKTFKDAITDKL